MAGRRGGVTPADSWGDFIAVVDLYVPAGRRVLYQTGRAQPRIRGRILFPI